MKALNKNLKERADFFKKIGPSVAGQMSKNLQELTAEKIKVEFKSIQTFEKNTVLVDVGEKVFGSYINFKSPGDNLEGIIVAIFPLTSTKVFIELLFKRYLKKLDKNKIDPAVKLSAFKEGVNILLQAYIKDMSNALKVKLKISLPKFVSFRNIKFMKPALLGRYSNLENLLSVGQLSITSYKSKSRAGGDGEKRPNSSSVSSIKGSLLLYFSCAF